MNNRYFVSSEIYHIAFSLVGKLADIPITTHCKNWTLCGGFEIAFYNIENKH